jgi:hypothetical protein
VIHLAQEHHQAEVNHVLVLKKIKRNAVAILVLLKQKKKPWSANEKMLVCGGIANGANLLSG